MISALPPAPDAAPLPLAPEGPPPAAPPPHSPWPKLLLAALALGLLALIASGLLWQKLATIQEQLARQSSDSTAQAVEARTVARQAQDLVRETAARLAVTEARLSEVALQRTQLEELMQSLSRSRDENLVVDIESAVRLAMQQAQLTGSAEPLLGALRAADQRIQRAAQPRLAPLQRAIARDTDRIKATALTDTPGLLARLDDLVRMADELPLQNAVGVPAGSHGKPGTPAAPTPSTPADAAWWQRLVLPVWHKVRDEARQLVRVSRVDRPEAALLAPEQAFFVRENFKLKLLNVRLGVLGRQVDSARADLAQATALLNRYFDPASRRTQAVATLLQEVQAQLRSVELPRLDDTLAALATAAAGR